MAADGTIRNDFKTGIDTNQMGPFRGKKDAVGDLEQRMWQHKMEGEMYGLNGGGMDVGGMGCCVRFKSVDDLSLDVIGKAIRRVPLKKYLADHVAVLARIGPRPTLIERDSALPPLPELLAEAARADALLGACRDAA